MGIFKTNDTEFEMYDPSDGDTIFTVDRSSLDIDLSDNTLSNLDDVSIEGDLQIATGRSIKDGSGVDRIETSSADTRINDGSGDQVFLASNGFASRIQAFNNQPFRVQDGEGNFNAFQYTTSSTAPGTLELSDAVLDADEPAEFADYRDLEPSSEPSTPSGDTLRLWVDQNDGNYKAKDAAGDTVTLITTE